MSFNSEEFPYYLLGDPAFPLSEYIITRFDNRGGRTANAMQERYNIKHYTMQGRVKRMSVLMKQRWRVILDKMYVSNLGTRSLVIECCILLHYFLIDKRKPLPKTVHENISNSEANVVDVMVYAREKYAFDPSMNSEKRLRNRERLVAVTNG